MEGEHRCPPEVVWESIDSDILLLDPMVRSVEFMETSKTPVPSHLWEDNVREFFMIVHFVLPSTLDEVDEYIRRVGHYAFEGNTGSRCWGTVFRRSHQKGFWSLHAPCLYCYSRLAKDGASPEALNKAALLCYL